MPDFHDTPRLPLRRWPRCCRWRRSCSSSWRAGVWCVLPPLPRRPARRARSTSSSAATSPAAAPPTSPSAAIGLAFVLSLTGFILFQSISALPPRARRAEAEHAARATSALNDRAKRRRGRRPQPRRQIDEGRRRSQRRSSTRRRRRLGGACDDRLDRHAFELARASTRRAAATPSAARRCSSASTSTACRRLMFVMVTFIATLIHLFSMGYMAEELERDGRGPSRPHRTRPPAPPRPLRPVLHVPVAVLLLDAQPDPGRQPLPGLRQLGTGRHLLVPAGRLLLRAAERLQRRQQGVHHQPRRRRRLHHRPADPLDLLRHVQLRGHLPPGPLAR